MLNMRMPGLLKHPGFSFSLVKEMFMDFKAIIALCLVLFILAGLGFLFVRSRKK